MHKHKHSIVHLWIQLQQHVCSLNSCYSFKKQRDRESCWKWENKWTEPTHWGGKKNPPKNMPGRRAQRNSPNSSMMNVHQGVHREKKRILRQPESGEGLILRTTRNLFSPATILEIFILIAWINWIYCSDKSSPPPQELHNWRSGELCAWLLRACVRACMCARARQPITIFFFFFWHRRCRLFTRAGGSQR